ncbi:MAG: hypothetical protein ACKOCH_04930, partial [Bacteroidota bacterium]
TVNVAVNPRLQPGETCVSGIISRAAMRVSWMIACMADSTTRAAMRVSWMIACMADSTTRAAMRDMSPSSSGGAAR